MSTAVALPYPLIYPQMAQMAQMDDKALTQAERALSEQYWVKTRDGFDAGLCSSAELLQQVGEQFRRGNHRVMAGSQLH